MILLVCMVALFMDSLYSQQQIPKELVGSFQGQLQPVAETFFLYEEDYHKPPSSCVRYRFHESGVWETEWQATADKGQSVCSKMQTSDRRWVQKPARKKSTNATIVKYECDRPLSGKLYVQYNQNTDQQQYYICVLFERRTENYLLLASGPPYFSSDYESASCPPVIEETQGITKSTFSGRTCQQADQDIGICQVALTFGDYMQRQSATCI